MHFCKTFIKLRPSAVNLSSDDDDTAQNERGTLALLKEEQESSHGVVAAGGRRTGHTRVVCWAHNWRVLKGDDRQVCADEEKSGTFVDALC